MHSSQHSARWIDAESQPQQEHSTSLSSSWAQGHQGHMDTHWLPGASTAAHETQGSPSAKGCLVFQGLTFCAFSHSLYSLGVTFCTVCPHRKVGNAILDSSSLCQSVQPDTAKECTRPTFWEFLKYPFLWQ